MMEKEWRDPEWGMASPIHDWRNYVTEKLQLMWPVLHDSVKEAIYEMACIQAHREIWE